MPKSGFSANSQGKVCAAAVVAVEFSAEPVFIPLAPVPRPEGPTMQDFAVLVRQVEALEDGLSSKADKDQLGPYTVAFEVPPEQTFPEPDPEEDREAVLGDEGYIGTHGRPGLHITSL